MSSGNSSNYEPSIFGGDLYDYDFEDSDSLRGPPEDDHADCFGHQCGSDQQDLEDAQKNLEQHLGKRSPSAFDHRDEDFLAQESICQQSRPERLSFDIEFDGLNSLYCSNQEAPPPSENAPRVPQSDPEGPIQPVKPPIQLKQKKTSVKSIDRSHLKQASKIIFHDIKKFGSSDIPVTDLEKIIRDWLTEDFVAQKEVRNKHYVRRTVQKVLKVMSARKLIFTDQNMVRVKNRALADVCALEARKYAHEQRNAEKRAQLSHLNSMYQTMQQLMKHRKVQQETQVYRVVTHQQDETTCRLQPIQSTPKVGVLAFVIPASSKPRITISEDKKTIKLESKVRLSPLWTILDMLVVP